MRSSDSANRIMINAYDPSGRYEGAAKKIAAASSQGRHSAGLSLDGTLYMLAEQPSRLPEQQAHGSHVDEEGAELRDPVLAGGIAHADEQRSDERPANASEAADRHDDQEVHELLERIGGRHGEQVRAERAAERGEAAAKCKG